MVPDDAPRRRRSSDKLCAIIAAIVALLATCVGASLTAPAASASTSPPPVPPNSSTTDAAKANKDTFGIGPASAKGIDGRPFLNYLVSPGSQLSDHAAIINFAYRPVTLSLYAADAVVGADGQFGYQPKAAARTDAASWIRLGTGATSSTITLGPRTTLVVPITITVPADASPGDHAAGVITSVTSQVTSKNGERVNFEQRIALRTFLRVSGPLRPGLAIQNFRVRYDDNLNPLGGGTATLTYTVRNTGNIRLGSHQRVSVSGLFGSKGPTKALADIPLLLPHSFVNESVTVHGVFPQFPMHARVTLYPLAVVGDVDPGVASKYTAAKAFWAIPWVLLAIVVALILGAAAWWYYRRNRGWRPPASHQFSRRGRKPTGPSGPNGKVPSTSPTVPSSPVEPART
jgi:hypothetical protein